MPDKKFDLGDYVEVKDRIKLFYELFGQGRLVTGEVRLTTEPDGKPRVLVQALAYRTPDDPLPGVGWSWMELPGKTSYTNGSELENVETSSWGRAIGSLGILIDKSIASGNEIRNKEGESAARNGAPPPIEQAPDGGLIGTASVGKGDADFNLRQTPDGHALTFRLVSGRKGVKVTAFSPLAEMLAGARDKILGARVTAWGTVSEESFDKVTDGKTTTITYPVMTLERIKGDGFDYAAPDEQDDVFTPDEQAAIDAAIAAAQKESAA